MLPVFLALVLTQGSGPVQLASVGFSSVRVQKNLATSFEQTLATRLQETKLVRVTTQSDVATILGVERQRQLLGCATDSSNCIAELAGALGVEGLITGEIALVGKVYQLTVRILSARDATVLYQALRRFKTEEAVLEGIDLIATEGAKQLHTTLRPAMPAPVTKPPSEVTTSPVTERPVELPKEVAPAPRAGPWLVVGAGGALLVAGAVLQGLAARDYGRVQDDSLLVSGSDTSALEKVAEEGKLKQIVGLSSLGAGGLALGVGLLWYFLGRDAAPTTSLWLSGEGAGIVVGGRL
jgi:hypothetical protein